MSVLSFYVNNEGKIENVSYDPALTIKEFILDFLNKIQYRYIDGNFGTEKFTFKLGCKILNTGKFLDKKIGDYIPPNGTVYIFEKKRNLWMSYNLRSFKNIEIYCKRISTRIQKSVVYKSK